MYYYIVHPRSKTNKITVVDLRDNFEVNDYSLVQPQPFYSRSEAIGTARELAARHNREYELFTSRYDEDTNEFLGEFDSQVNGFETITSKINEINNIIQQLEALKASLQELS